MFLNLYLKPNTKIFNNILYSSKNENLYLKCADCNYSPKIIDFSYDFGSTDSLLIRFPDNNRNKNIIFEDYMEFNNDYLKFQWKITAAIKYRKLVVRDGGVRDDINHYTCLRKVKNGWLELDDQNCSFHSTFSFENIYLLFLNKAPRNQILNKISISKSCLETPTSIDLSLNYFLRLKNNNNICYLNSILQALITLGPKILDEVKEYKNLLFQYFLF